MNYSFPVLMIYSLVYSSELSSKEICKLEKFTLMLSHCSFRFMYIPPIKICDPKGTLADRGISNATRSRKKR